ncbi:VCBS domain-containing protein [Aliinostoc sp. HNIBRCY26]|uniref:VCBS domain-containing protein n=1 Tax=Aliinostoc sp. HNIBRCY26 TaxID=3418997 RepID=UPI003CFD1D54
MSDPKFLTIITNPFSLNDVGFSAVPTLADIDGDGDLDVFVGSNNGDTLFYRNTGTAIAPQFVFSGTNPFGLTDVGLYAAPTFADIDGDGDLDAFVGNRDGNTLFYRNTGTAAAPQFVLTSTNPFGLTDVGNYAKPTFADIDGDGDLDAFVGNRDGNMLFYRNTGTAKAPQFAAPITNPFGLTNVGYNAAPTFADVDRDGDLDAFVGNLDGNTLFYRNTGTAAAPQFAAPITNPFGLANVGLLAAPTFADIDGDNDLDAFVGNLEGNTLFFTNQPDPVPSFRFLAPITNPFGFIDVGVSASPTFADIDDDGDLDAFVGNGDSNTLFYRNTGSAKAPQFAAPITNPFGLTNAGNAYASPALADIDGDGDFDAFVSNNSGNTLFFRNTGTKTNPVFASPATNPFGLTNPGNDAAPTFVDIDGDGDLDAFVGINNGNTVFFRNTGTQTNPVFASPTTNPFGLTNVGSWSSPTFADIDGDGDFDAFLGNEQGDTVFFRNTGTKTNPVFAAPITNPFGLISLKTSFIGAYAAPTLVDIDGDGDFDAFVGNRNGNTVFFEFDYTLTAVNDAVSTNENNVLNGNVLTANPTTPDSDIDGNPLTVTAVNGSAANVGTKINLGNGKLTVNADGTFSFDPTNGTATLTDGYDYLAQGVNATVSFKYTISNRNNRTDSATVIITITGVNDTATITGTTTGAVTEDGSAINLIGTNGFLTVDDVDTGENRFKTTFTSASGNLGSFIISESGRWNYFVDNSAVQFLGAGVTKTETFTVQSFDGTAQDIVVTITGVNDAATITGTATAAVTEDATTPNLTATGSLVVNDVDTGENKFNTTVTGINNLGSLSITETGTWNYTIANSAVQSLGAGVTKTETFTVKSVDGTASQDIVVTINGVNDVPTLAQAIADQTVTANQSFNFVIPVDTFADVDAGDILTYSATLDNDAALPSWLQFNPNTRTFSGTPTINDTGIFNIKITASDSQGATVTDILALTVNGSNIINGDDNDNSLSGTPNADIINGFGGNDYIEGLAENDIIDGGTGRFDRIFGGNGNDEIIDPDGILGAHGGTGNDTINITFAANWDNDTNSSTAPRSDGKITGGYGSDTITVTMNNSQFFINLKGDESVSNTPQDGDDVVTLLGSYQNAVVDLGGGNDTFIGGIGSDNVSGGAGNDTIFGFGGNDKLTGNDGDDILVGGAGNDNLTGGNGKDIFSFSSPLSDGIDTITDFSVLDDKIRVDAVGFGGGLVAGVLAQTQFVLGSVAQNESSRFIYNQSTGTLFFDVDGTGSSRQVQIATLSNKAVIDSTNIVVIEL